MKEETDKSKKAWWEYIPTRHDIIPRLAWVSMLLLLSASWSRLNGVLATFESSDTWWVAAAEAAAIDIGIISLTYLLEQKRKSWRASPENTPAGKAFKRWVSKFGINIAAIAILSTITISANALHIYTSLDGDVYINKIATAIVVVIFGCFVPFAILIIAETVSNDDATKMKQAAGVETAAARMIQKLKGTINEMKRIALVLNQDKVKLNQIVSKLNQDKAELNQMVAELSQAASERESAPIVMNQPLSDLGLAMLQVLVNGTAVRQASRDYKVTHSTLQRIVNNVTQKDTGVSAD